VTIANGKTRQPGTKPRKNLATANTMTIDPNRVTAASLAGILHTSKSVPGQWFKKGMPRNADSSYCIADVFEWHKSRIAGKGDPVVDDVEMVQSPALERYREERAKLARLDRLKKEEEVMPTAHVRRGCELIGAAFRKVGEFAKRKGYADVLQIINERLDEAQRHAETEFGAVLDGSPVRSGKGTPSSDDA